ncbi:MAG: hypothetical protein ABEK59_08435 [Halobacteria archaeon]
MTEEEIEGLKEKPESTIGEVKEEDDGPDIEELRKTTKREDRLSEKTEEVDEEEEDDDGINYTPIDDVIYRENKKGKVHELKEQTSRSNRIEEDDQEEMELRPFTEFDFGFEVDAPYCGNCRHVEFKKHKGKPAPFCTEWDVKTNLKPDMVCADYEPQGVIGDEDSN